MDNTRIAVSERGILEILDLSLQLSRRYVKPLAITLAMGVAPLMLLNHLLVGWMADIDWEDSFPFHYVWSMIVLVIIEAPLASVFATTYLGMSVFDDKPSLWRVVKDVYRFALRLGWAQLLVRGIGAACLMFLFVNRDNDISVTVIVEGLLIPALAIYCVLLRAFRPFINEVILLEKNPLRAKNSSTITISRRSGLLHGPSGGELLGRSIVNWIAAILLFSSLYSTFHFLSGVFLNDWTQGPIMIQLVLPLTLWLVAGYFTVVRFLSYLDLRIRQEGWEVELRLRSEAAILHSKML